MLVYHGTNWLYRFEIEPINEDVFTITDYDGSVADIDDSPYGIGLYCSSNIDDTDEYQYCATAHIESTDIVDFDSTKFHENGDSYEGSVYRLLQTHNAINCHMNRARHFKVCLDMSLNQDVKAVNIDGTIIIFDQNIIDWGTINVNENIQCVPFDPFK